MTREELAALARQAMLKAYAPYSGYWVGAALLCKNGHVYLGCNIENAAYTPTTCAERTAFFKAISEGESEFAEIAVCGSYHGQLGQDLFPPCGVCRQVMREFCEDSFKIHMVASDRIETRTLEELLPFSFRPERLTEK